MRTQEMLAEFEVFSLERGDGDNLEQLQRIKQEIESLISQNPPMSPEDLKKAFSSSPTLSHLKEVLNLDLLVMAIFLFFDICFSFLFGLTLFSFKNNLMSICNA